MNTSGGRSREPRALSAHEQATLRELGVPEELLTREANAAARAQLLASTLAHQRAEEKAALSTRQVAELLSHDDPAQIGTLLSRGQLYALPRSGREPRFPLWQFAGGAVVPGLSVVLADVPPGMPSYALEAFMTQPTDALTGNPDNRMSPIEWLLSGGDPTYVANLLARRDEQ